ncbi:MAG: Asp-tRNA(Asn)/Glu-tRNA(Gln) amidotransferase subunit GatC [Chloroflexi bacterium]|nr:Asp-tRNA(Asn)/Glu-tRNA(Gln) amidotransferase subunit GatC [Chloroflexota bacterium]
MVTEIEVERIAHLARLELSRDERVRFASHLAAVLDHAAALESLELDEIPPTASVLSVHSIVREEDVVGVSLPRQSVLANAPATDGAGFVVQATLGDGGG